MLKYKLVEETPSNVVYEYFPEGDTKFGVVSFDKKSNANSIVTLAPQDRHRRYAQKLFSKIKEFANNDSFDKEGMIAWY